MHRPKRSCSRCCTLGLETEGLLWQYSFKKVSASPRSLIGCPCRPSVEPLSPSRCTRHAQAIDRRPMHRHGTAHSRFSSRDSLLHLPDYLTFGSLAKLWGDISSSGVLRDHHRVHHGHSFSVFLALQALAHSFTPMPGCSGSRFCSCGEPPRWWAPARTNSRHPKATYQTSISMTLTRSISPLSFASPTPAACPV